jgi:hypothetical protein
VAIGRPCNVQDEPRTAAARFLRHQGGQSLGLKVL